MIACAAAPLHRFFLEHAYLIHATWYHTAQWLMWLRCWAAERNDCLTAVYKFSTIAPSSVALVLLAALVNQTSTDHVRSTEDQRLHQPSRRADLTDRARLSWRVRIPVVRVCREARSIKRWILFLAYRKALQYRKLNTCVWSTHCAHEEVIESFGFNPPFFLPARVFEDAQKSRLRI